MKLSESLYIASAGDEAPDAEEVTQWGVLAEMLEQEHESLQASNAKMKEILAAHKITMVE